MAKIFSRNQISHSGPEVHKRRAFGIESHIWKVKCVILLHRPVGSYWSDENEEKWEIQNMIYWKKCMISLSIKKDTVGNI